MMPDLVIAGLDEPVLSALSARALKNGRSLEDEVRAILRQAVSRPNIGVALMHAVGEVGGMDDLSVAGREDQARSADFS